MIHTNELFVIPILLLALVTISITAPILGIKTSRHQYASIDGLRGFLAMLVFIYHSSIWYWVVNFNDWLYPRPNVFRHFGPTSVMMFFMITSFLFFSKLIDAAHSRQMDWLKLYVSRILRIVPLYLLAILLLFFIVGYIMHFILHESFGSLLVQVGQWFLIMAADIDGFEGTKTIILVQWSLAYEWLFYCSLTFSGWVFFDLKPPLIAFLWTFVFSIVFALAIYEYYSQDIWIRLSPFGTGILAAVICRQPKLKVAFSKNWVLIFAIAGICVAVQFEPSFWTLIAVSLLFIVIVCGNSLFGLLTWKPCRLLGQISYSIYLLHGLLLFTTFNLVMGGFHYEAFPAFSYWSIICICCIVLIIICSMTYRFIEKPGIDSVSSVTQWIQKRSQRPRSEKGRLLQGRP